MPSIQSLIVDEVIPFDKKIKSKLKGVTPFDSHIIVTPSGTILLQLLKKRQKFPSISSLSLAAKLSLSFSLCRCIQHCSIIQFSYFSAFTSTARFYISMTLYQHCHGFYIEKEHKQANKHQAQGGNQVADYEKVMHTCMHT